ncbi:MAG: arsenate reductase (glutaredoxin), partial [Pseudomonadota bacterium]|nr:arsenate reductase (glutaredoxin) [Pseudomonadota bacterium]
SHPIRRQRDAMAEYTLYHNPRCSKSRQALALLEENGITPTIVKYLDTPPDAETVRTLVKQLRLDRAHDLVRPKEAEYKEAGLSRDADDDTVINAIARYPKLLERPVLVKGDRAVIGRPPETVLELVTP